MTTTKLPDLWIEALRGLLRKRGFKLDHTYQWHQSGGQKHCRLRLVDDEAGSPFVMLYFSPDAVHGWEKWNTTKPTGPLAVPMMAPDVVDVVIGWYRKYAKPSGWAT